MQGIANFPRTFQPQTALRFRGYSDDQLAQITIANALRQQGLQDFKTTRVPEKLVRLLALPENQSPLYLRSRSNPDGEATYERNQEMVRWVENKLIALIQDKATERDDIEKIDEQFRNGQPVNYAPSQQVFRAINDRLGRITDFMPDEVRIRYS